MSAEQYPSLSEFVEGIKNSSRIADDPINALIELLHVVTIDAINSCEQAAKRNERLLSRTRKLAHRLGQKCLDLIRDAKMPGIVERTSVLRVVSFIEDFADDDPTQDGKVLNELIRRSADQDLPLCALVDAVDALRKGGSLPHAAMSDWMPTYVWKAVFDRADTALRNHMKIRIEKKQAEGGRGSGHNGYRVMLAILTPAERTRLDEQIAIINGKAKTRARPRK